MTLDKVVAKAEVPEKHISAVEEFIKEQNARSDGTAMDVEITNRTPATNHGGADGTMEFTIEMHEHSLEYPFITETLDKEYNSEVTSITIDRGDSHMR